MFQEKLKEARMTAKLSQKELAKMLYISQQAYAQYETGASSPNPETLKRIAEILQVSLDDLLENARTVNDPRDEMRNDDFSFALYNETKDLTQEQRQLILDLARQLKGKE